MDPDNLDFFNRLKGLVGDGIEWVDPDSTANGSHNLSEASADHTQDSNDSDASADMIFSMHHVRQEQKSNGQGAGKSNTKTTGQRPVVDITEMENVDWDEPDLKRGEESVRGETFVPWKFVQDYPKMYVGKKNGEKVAPAFEEEAIHDNRVWDLFYLHHPPQISRKPIFFVPTYQFEHLLEVVNGKYGTALTIPPGKNAEKFNLSFGTGGTPCPRYLGRSSSWQTFNQLSARIPSMQAGDALEKATTLAGNDFIEILNMIWNAAHKTSGKGNKAEKTRRKRIQEHLAWGKSLKRVQRYLGLRETGPVHPSKRLKSTELDEPLPIVPDQSVLFVAIDIEAYELNQNVITEVGVAVLDTEKIQGVAPGESGKNWFDLIQAHHLRIRENAWAVNGKHVHGCPDQFNFGQSEFLDQGDVGKAIERLINVPLSTNGKDGHGLRPVVLVFHESRSDIAFLQTLGINILGFDNVVDVADTRHLHQYLTRSLESSSLRTVLAYLRLDSCNLHNGGNDAVYTLHSMISLVIKKRPESLQKAPSKKDRRTPMTYGDLEDFDGWSSGGEDTDGGEGTSPSVPVVRRPVLSWTDPPDDELDPIARREKILDKAFGVN